jgi:ribonuclease P protein component
MLPRHLRLRRPRDFEAARQQGQHLRGRLLSLNVLPNNLSHNRFGVVLSKHVGRAATRNHLKRRLRSAIWHLLPGLVTGYDVVVIAHPPASSATYQELENMLEKILRSAGFLMVD